MSTGLASQSDAFLHPYVPAQNQGSREMSNRRGRSALDRPLPMRGKNEVGLSAFAFLFSEFIQYSQLRVNTAEELERK